MPAFQIWFKNRRAKFRKMHRKHILCEQHESFDERYECSGTNSFKQQSPHMNKRHSPWHGSFYSGSEQEWSDERHFSPYLLPAHESNMQISTVARTVPCISAGHLTLYPSQPQCFRPVHSAQPCTLNLNHNPIVRQRTFDAIVPSFMYDTLWLDRIFKKIIQIRDWKITLISNFTNTVGKIFFEIFDFGKFEIHFYFTLGLRPKSWNYKNC